MIYFIFVLIVAICLGLWRYLGGVALFGVLIAILNIYSGFYFDSDPSRQDFRLLIFYLPYLVFATLIYVSGPAKISLEFRSQLLLVQQRIKVYIGLILGFTYAILNSIFLVTNKSVLLLGSLPILVNLEYYLLNIFSILLLTIAAVDSRMLTSTLTATLIVGSNLFGPSRGGIIFPLMTYIVLRNEIQKIIRLEKIYKFKDLKVLLVSFPLAVVLFILISLDRYGLDLETNVIFAAISTRADTIIHYNNANSSGVSIDRDPFEVIVSTFLFWLPRSIYPTKPYLPTYEITRKYLGEEIANQATFNFGPGWIGFISSLDGAATVYILELGLAYVYFRMIMSRREGLFGLIFFATTGAHIVGSFQTSFADGPAARSAASGMFVSLVVVLILKFKKFSGLQKK
jgi:hypothetical protein